MLVVGERMVNASRYLLFLQEAYSSAGVITISGRYSNKCSFATMITIYYKL